MVILHICEYAAPYKGNFIESLQALEGCNGVKNIYLFPERANRTAAFDWIKTLNGDEKCAYIQKKGFFQNLRLLKQIINDHNPDFIFRHFTNIETDLLVKMSFKSEAVVRFFHSMYIPDRNKFKVMFKKVLWKNNAFVGVSRANAQILKDCFENFDVHCIENSVNFSRLKPENHNKETRKITLLAFGYNVKTKGIDLALHTLKKLKVKYDIELLIVAASHRDDVITCINEIFGEHPSYVKVLEPTEDVSEYFNKADIFLSPSRNEAFGYAVIEAAFFEKSIVASRVGGQGELEVDAAYWFESENLDDLYEKTELAINQLYNEDKIITKRITAKKVKKLYSIDNWANTVVHLLTQIPRS